MVRILNFVVIFLLFIAVGTGCRIDNSIEGSAGESSKSPEEITEAIANLSNFVSSDVTAAEGDGSVEFEIVLTEPAPEDITLNFTVDGSSSGSDHDFTDGTIVIPAGETTGTGTINISQDSVNEGNETLIITIVESSETFTLTITDDDPLPDLTITTVTGLEGETFEFPVVLSAASGRDVTFDYTISHTTTSAADFAVASGTFTIPEGTTSTVLQIQTIQDGAIDVKETFDINFSNPMGASLLTASVSSDITELIVENRYPVEGPDWDDHIMGSADVACSLPQIVSACQPARFAKDVRVPAFSSCANLELVDNQSAFEWRCDDSGSEVVFSIVDFNIGKGLKSLVTEAGFNNLKVILEQSSTPIMESELVAGWWGNPIIPLPDNSGPTSAVVVLNTAGAIYVEDIGKFTRGYNINADGVSIVIAQGQTLTLENSPPTNCDSSSGETGSNFRSIVCVGSQNYTWMEGNLAFGSGSQKYGYWWHGSNHTVVHGSTVYGNGDSWAVSDGNGNANLRITQVDIQGGEQGIHANTGGVYISDVSVSSTTYGFFGAIELAPGNDLVMKNIRSMNNAGDGINIDNLSTGGIIHNVVSSNNDGHGLFLAGKDYVITDALFANNGQDGFHFTDSSSQWDVALINVTAPNNVGVGIKTANYYSAPFVGGAYLVNSVSSNNDIGLEVSNTFGSTEMYFYNTFLDSNTSGIEMDDISEIGFFDLLGVNSGTLCVLTTLGANVGIADTTCALSAPSTGTLLGGSFDASSSFVGKAGTDSVNGTMGASTNTAIVYGSIEDRINFENPYRVWGRDGSAYPNNDNRNRCSSGTCNIWDYTLDPSDTVLRDVNGAFVDGAACPSSVDGTNWAQMAGFNRALLYALEVMGDGAGDDDGLCESDEACIYSPHGGAYQGDKTGDYRANTCIFNDGPGSFDVKGVTMYAYP